MGGMFPGLRGNGHSLTTAPARMAAGAEEWYHARGASRQQEVDAVALGVPCGGRELRTRDILLSGVASPSPLSPEDGDRTRRRRVLL